MKEPSSPLVKIFAALLIPVLLYLIYVAACWGLADVYYRPVSNVIERWQRQKITLKDEDWDRLQQKLQKALALDPGNPDINHAYGTTLEGRYVYHFSGDEVAQQARLRAAEYYRLAISQRPTWPYTWADFALVKYRLNEMDEEYLRALHTAIKMGPWEPGVQYVIAFLGFRTWDKLSEQDRAFIVNMVKNSFSHADGTHVGRMLTLVEDYQFLPVFCPLVPDNKRVAEYCSKESMAVNEH